MKDQELKSNFLLLLTAAIWGFAFVAQRVGSKYVGAFTFNGIRFALGSISLIPVIMYYSKKTVLKPQINNRYVSPLPAGIIGGCILFFGASLQQIGLLYTTAGKAGFITGLYIVLVPVFGIFLKHKIKFSTWIGVAFAVTGLYFLSVNDNFSISKGDIFQIVGAVFWATHILVIDYFVRKVDALKLSFIQFVTCSVLSITVGLIFERTTLQGLHQAIIPILYGGICSVGIAYTLQVIAQQHAKPSHAAIILSMESVFASLGGLIILNEKLGVRGYLGCILMLSGMLLSQLQNFRRSR